MTRILDSKQASFTNICLTCLSLPPSHALEQQRLVNHATWKCIHQCWMDVLFPTRRVPFKQSLDYSPASLSLAAVF